jgi:hypothetical protein
MNTDKNNAQLPQSRERYAMPFLLTINNFIYDKY